MRCWFPFFITLSPAGVAAVLEFYLLPLVPLTHISSQRRSSLCWLFSFNCSPVEEKKEAGKRERKLLKGSHAQAAVHSILPLVSVKDEWMNFNYDNASSVFTLLSLLFPSVSPSCLSAFLAGEKDRQWVTGSHEKKVREGWCYWLQLLLSLSPDFRTHSVWRAVCVSRIRRWCTDSSCTRCQSKVREPGWKACRRALNSRMNF